MTEMRRCYDCHRNVSDWVLDPRVTGGESHALRPTQDWEHVPICANRRECQKAQRKAFLAQDRDELAVYLCQLLDAYSGLHELIPKGAKLYAAEGELPEGAVMGFKAECENIMPRGYWSPSEATACHERLQRKEWRK